MSQKKQLLPITVVGAYPKPDYLEIPDWFRSGMLGFRVNDYDQFLKDQSSREELEKQILRATQEVIREQEDVGIDIITDGEVRRENYIHYFCRFLDGISFEDLTNIKIRNRNFDHLAPTITGNVRHPEKPILVNEWLESQKLTNRPVKMTIPGPMTILDTVADNHYHDHEIASLAIAKAINQEIKYLQEAGCQYIQVDEPILTRHPELALKYGIKHLEKCFEGIFQPIKRIVHICCGYPNQLDQKNYPKANHRSYYWLAPALDRSPVIDAISIEDTHRRNDLSLFGLFKQTEIILGVINIASTKIETVNEIKEHIKEVLKITKLLSIAPDCGLGMLPIEICRVKINNMVQAVKEIRKELNNN